MALALRDIGALYQTCYLVATFLDLAPCALGCVETTEAGRLGDICGFEAEDEPLLGGFVLGPKRQ